MEALKSKARKLKGESAEERKLLESEIVVNQKGERRKQQIVFVFVVFGQKKTKKAKEMFLVFLGFW